MKIRFVLSHPSSQLFGEIREAVIALELVRQGHDAQIYRVYGAPAVKRVDYAGQVPVTYFPANDPRATPHQTVSDALFNALSGDMPDILLIKGIGYDIVSYLLDRLTPGRPRIGFILGGTAVDPALARANFVLAESESQIEEVRKAAGRPLPCRTLAKLIDWDTADRLHAERQAAAGRLPYDIVNVGQFEPRKNHIALRCFFGRYNVAMVGTGEMLDTVRHAAAGFDKVDFLGALPNSEALAIMARARLMVHCSHWEGVPRALFESLACGTPVVALEGAIQERFDTTAAVHLTTESELQGTVERLLAHPLLLDLMSKEGRRFAQERHGPERLAEAAKYILSMAGEPMAVA